MSTENIELYRQEKFHHDLRYGAENTDIEVFINNRSFISKHRSSANIFIKIRLNQVKR